MNKNVAASLAVVAALLAILFSWRLWVSRHLASPIKSPDKGAATVLDFDSFQTALADRVRTRFNVAPGSVVVADVAYDVGTLLDPVQAYPSDDSDCLPKPLPPIRSADNLFPSYKLSRDTAVQTTLGSSALQKLTSASLNLTGSDNLTYSINDVSVQFMDMRTLEQLATAGACGTYVSRHPGVRLIRGVVMGRISFTADTNNHGNVEAGLKGLGGVNVSTNPGSTQVTVADEKSTQILHMLAVIEGPAPTVNPAPTANPAPPPPGRSPASVEPRPSPVDAAPKVIREDRAIQGTGPATGSFVARIYLQQDAADSPDLGTKFARALQANWPKAQVIEKVERVPSAKMPGGAQVRFFNAADADLANKCRDHLKEIGVDARVVRIGLGAPQGQLEVWLAKSGS